MPRDLSPQELDFYNQRSRTENILEQPEPVMGRSNLFGSAVDGLQGQLYGLAEAAGLRSVRDLRLANEAEASRVSNAYYRQTGNPRTMGDISSAGDLGSYVLDKAVESAPTMGAIVGASLVNPAAAFGMSSLLGTADVVDNQRQAGGRTNLAAAVPLGLAYGASDMLLGSTAALARRGLGTGVKALDDLGTSALANLPGKTGAATRFGVNLLKTGAAEAVDETFQELMNRTGRTAVSNEKIFDDEALDSYGESAFAGGLLGGVFGLPGAVGAARGRKAPTIDSGAIAPVKSVDNPAQPTNLLDTQQTRPGGLLPPGPMAQGSLFNSGDEGTVSWLPEGGAQLPPLNSLLEQRQNLRGQLDTLQGMYDEAEQEFKATGDADVWGQKRNRLMGMLGQLSPLADELEAQIEQATRNEAGNYGRQGALDFSPEEQEAQRLGLGYQGPLAGTPIVFPDGSVALSGEQELDRRYGLSKPWPAQPVEPGRPIQVDMFGNAAATREDVNKQNDPGAVIARQQWAKQQASVKQAKAVEEQIKADEAAAAQYNVKGGAGVKLFVQLRQMLTDGDIQQDQFNTLVGTLAARKQGEVKREINSIYAQAQQEQLIEQSKAAELQASIDKVQKKASNGTPTTQAQQAAPQGSQAPAAAAPAAAVSTQAPVVSGEAPVVAGTLAERTKAKWDEMATATPGMPAYETLTKGQIARAEDLVNREVFNLAGASNVVGSGDNLPATKTAGGEVAGIAEGKTVSIGRKGREKSVTASELVTKMEKAAPLEKARIAAAVGFEATVDPTTGAPKLVQIGEPQTLEAIAAAESKVTGKKVTKEAIRLSLIKFGITPEVIDRVQAVAVNTVSAEELAINPEENGSGYRVETQASKATGQGLVDDGVGETKKQREARAQADEILKTADHSAELAMADDHPTNLPEGTVVTDLRENNPSTIDANIQALLNHREANNAAADWDDGVVSWDALPDTLKVEWIEEYVWNMKANDGEVDFKELEGEQKRIESEYKRYRIYAGQQASTRAISGGNAGAGSRSGMVEGAEAERPQLSDQSSGSRDAEKVTDVEDRPVTPFTQELTTEPVEEKKPAPKPKTVADMVTLGQLRMAGQIWGQYAPEGVKWESQSPEQQKQWAMVAIEQRMPNMADAQAIAEGTFPVAEVEQDERPTTPFTGQLSTRSRKAGRAQAQITDESNIIDVEARVVDETVRPQVAALPAPQVQQLEKHYGLKRDSAEFLAKVKEDVVLYATKGAEAVAGAIRHIIKSIANGVLSVAMIFNPMHITSPEAFVVVPKATVVTTTREVKAELPSNVKGMSEAGKQAYATLIPALSTQIGEKLITIADKPSGQIFVFDAKGNLVVQKKTLFGLAKGDLYKGNNDLPKNRITPAGLFGLKLVDAAKGGSAAKTAGEYDFGKVFAFEDPDAVVTIMHSVWLKEKDAAKRSAALKDANPANSRYSFGCINVDKDTYKFLLDNYQSKMDGSKLFIVPDEQAKVGDFLAGNVPYDKMNRQSVGKTTETVTSVMGGNGATGIGQERTIVGKKEDDAQVEKAKFSKSNKAFKGSDAKALAAELRSFMRVGTLGNRVVVVQSIKDIPAGVQRSVGASDNTQGFVFGGKAYLIADQIAAGNGRAVFMHEVGAHLGMEEILGAHYDTLVNKIMEWAKRMDNSQEFKLADKAMQRALDAAGDGEFNDTELVAYFIEEAVNAGIEPSALKHGPLRQFLQQVFDLFKKAIARFYGNPDKVTAQDFVDLAYGAARIEMKEPINPMTAAVPRSSPSGPKTLVARWPVRLVPRSRWTPPTSPARRWVL